MNFRRDKNVFTCLSRLNFRHDSRHDKNANHVIVLADRLPPFQARHLRKFTLLSWLISGATKTYIYIYILLSHLIAPSRGDLTRGVSFRRACQAPTHSD